MLRADQRLQSTMQVRPTSLRPLWLAPLLVGAALAPWPLAAQPAPPAPPSPPSAPSVTELRVDVDGGYSPAVLEADSAHPVRVVFVRHDRGPCTREVVFPALNVRRTLTTGQATAIELGALQPGEYEFRCGMNMLRGTLRVRSVAAAPTPTPLPTPAPPLARPIAR